MDVPVLPEPLHRFLQSGLNWRLRQAQFLIHHYRINEDEQIVRANLIVATTHNNQAMNEAIRQVALEYLDGQELSEGLLNHIEVAIRAFDPCLSCATHALGKMPLELELVDAAGSVVRRLRRD